jgi:hypothetical protein
MSLDWKLSKIADYKAKCWNADGSMSAVTRVIIFGLMAACVPSITAKNWREVARRFAVLQSVNGAFLNEWREETVNGETREVRVERFVTADDIERHVGLETNATSETAARFDARMRRVSERMARNAQ